MNQEVSQLMTTALQTLLTPVIKEVAELWIQRPGMVSTQGLQEALSHGLLRHLQSVKKPQCQAVTRKGLRCKRRTLTPLCGIHAPRPHPDRVQCVGTTKKALRCKRQFISKHGVTTCYQHRAQSPVEEVTYAKTCVALEELHQAIRTTKAALMEIRDREVRERPTYAIKLGCQKHDLSLDDQRTYTPKRLAQLIESAEAERERIRGQRDAFVREYYDSFRTKIEHELKPHGAALTALMSSLPKEAAEKQKVAKELHQLYTMTVGWAELTHQGIQTRRDDMIEQVDQSEESFVQFLQRASVTANSETS